MNPERVTVSALSASDSAVDLGRLFADVGVDLGKLREVCPLTAARI
jgi:hypothetical protein